MEDSMKNLRSALTVPLLVVLAVTLAVACEKKEAPGPTPEPTPIVEPTVAPEPTPDVNAAVCFSPASGAPGGGVCKNAEGKFVTCPGDTTGLPDCVN
jgi:hypothetical protein